MNKITALCLTALFSGCAVHTPPETPTAAAFDAIAELAPTGAAPVNEVEVESVDIEELDNGLVCEPRKRGGSRIQRRVCYNREEYAANAEAREEQARETVRTLDQQQRNMEMMRQQQEAARRQGVTRAAGL